MSASTCRPFSSARGTSSPPSAARWRTPGSRPSLLLLELTESVLLRNDEGIAANLTELQRLGVRLAIDDFGTGYSSLSYLRELPIDILKIDRSFVEGITASQRRLALAKGIVAIASTLDIAVVAEGIETREQCDVLTEMGCEYGQGYLLARPMSWHDGQQLLRANDPLTPPARQRETGGRTAAGLAAAPIRRHNGHRRDP